MGLIHTNGSKKRVAEAYAKVNPDDLQIRDLLALDRTVLANERTLLAFIRTAIVLAASGLTLIKFLPDEIYFVVLGYALLPISIVFLLIGFKRYLRTRKALLSVNDLHSSS